MFHLMCIKLNKIIIISKPPAENTITFTAHEAHGMYLLVLIALEAKEEYLILESYVAFVKPFNRQKESVLHALRLLWANAANSQ